MDSEDLIKLSPFCDSPNGNEDDAVLDSGCTSLIGDLSNEISVVREDGENARILENIGGIEVKDEPRSLASGFDEDMDISSPGAQYTAELTETVPVTEVVSLRSERKAANGFPTASESKRRENVLSGTKRTHTTFSEQQPSVRVIYNSIARESKQKLEELLQQWSQWHARHCTSTNDSNELLESGEEMHFPALNVGRGNSSAVSFWMDNQSENLSNKEFIPSDGITTPLYDRGFSFALSSDDGPTKLESNLDVLNSSRCFNCGSYNHSLRECPKPRDSIAVNNARKQQKSKRSQNASSRNPTRYYQSSPRGKFDGLRPGALDTETRQLLGLGELDPPPWLNKMREIGYPPGYLDPDDKDQPSGITIFSDEQKIQHETEEGEILEGGYLEPPKKMSPEPPRKMSVEFPGVNAPIPENVDRRLWEARSSSSNFSRSHSRLRYDFSTDSFSREPHYGRNEGRADYQDDAPPGTDSWSSSYRYGNYSSGRRSPSYGRSLSDRSRRSP